MKQQGFRHNKHPRHHTMPVFGFRVSMADIAEDRIGGNIDYIKHGGPGYFERNNSQRIVFTGAVSRRLNNETSLQLKSSYSTFNRKITIPGYTFDARQQSSLSELTWNKNLDKSDWILILGFMAEKIWSKFSVFINFENFTDSRQTRFDNDLYRFHRCAGFPGYLCSRRRIRNEWRV